MPNLQIPSTRASTHWRCYRLPLPTHGEFKVAGTVFAEAKAKDYTREQWEVALEKAEERAEPDSWPLIITDDFY
jgi:hypothetical protein